MFIFAPAVAMLILSMFVLGVAVVIIFMFTPDISTLILFMFVSGGNHANYFNLRSR